MVGLPPYSPRTAIYRGRSFGRKLWACMPCEAWVGTHRDSPNHHPLGRLANAELRQLKVKAHALFDPLWTAAAQLRGWPRGRARNAAYKWLGAQLDLSAKECHIGNMDEAQTRAAIALLELLAARRRAHGPPFPETPNPTIR